MNQTTYAMLSETLACFTKAFGSKRIGWDRFLEVIAVDHQFSLAKGIEDVFSWVKTRPELRDAFLQSYNPDLFHGDHYDYLGDLYFEHVFNGDARVKIKRLPSEQQLEHVVASLSHLSSDKTYSVLDPEAGTGRALLAIHHAESRIIPFGVERDLDLYRIALTNFAIHRIPGFLLHADYQYHETDIASPAGRSNWGFANRWNSAMPDLQPTTLTTPHDHLIYKNGNGDR